MSDRPLLVTSDPDLLDDLLRLCAAAGVEASVAADLTAARGSWAAAPVVVLGEELSGPALAAGLPRRSDLLIAGLGLDDAEVWVRAAALGAEGVGFLPEAQSWLVDRIAAACAGPVGAARVVAVVGGRGGAGASTLACALAVTAASVAGDGAPTVLVDADPLGGGLDLVLGCEDLPGLRWPDLTSASGAVSGPALAAALPHRYGLHLLSWDRGQPQRGHRRGGAVRSCRRRCRRTTWWWRTCRDSPVPSRTWCSRWPTWCCWSCPPRCAPSRRPPGSPRTSGRAPRTSAWSCAGRRPRG